MIALLGVQKDKQRENKARKLNAYHAVTSCSFFTHMLTDQHTRAMT